MQFGLEAPLGAASLWNDKVDAAKLTPAATVLVLVYSMRKARKPELVFPDFRCPLLKLQRPT